MASARSALLRWTSAGSSLVSMSRAIWTVERLRGLGYSLPAAVGIPGFCAFFNLYGPQSLLPSLAREFDASPAQISLTITATTLVSASPS